MKLNKMIDHTLLSPQGTREEVLEICRQAVEHDFASVVVNSCHIELVTEALKGSDVKPCSVIGFPFGACLTEVKGEETRLAVEKGAREVDMVINIGRLKEGDEDYVQRDIRAVVEAAGDAGVKVILETCLLSEEEIVKGCRLAMTAGADFVKTSTGYSTGGATAEVVRLMRATVGDAMGVKASGGIRDYETAMEMIEAGADRIGASKSVEIISGSKE